MSVNSKDLDNEKKTSLYSSCFMVWIQRQLWQWLKVWWMWNRRAGRIVLERFCHVVKWSPNISTIISVTHTVEESDLLRCWFVKMEVENVQDLQNNKLVLRYTQCVSTHRVWTHGPTCCSVAVLQCSCLKQLGQLDSVGGFPCWEMVLACEPACIELPSTWSNEYKDVFDFTGGWADRLMCRNSKREDREIMRRGPLAPCLVTQWLRVGLWCIDGRRCRWVEHSLELWQYELSLSYNNTPSLCTSEMWARAHIRTEKKNNRPMLFILTASMPDSCMPMLTTIMVMTCQRTQRSLSRPRTEMVSMEDRERCSSCISSTSAWMFPLVRYHFKAERSRREAFYQPTETPVTTLASKSGETEDMVSKSLKNRGQKQDKSVQLRWDFSVLIFERRETNCRL